EAHFWNAAELAWNPDQYYWNEWSALMVKEFCDPENVILAIKGAKQSGKSTTIMAIGMVLFYGAWKKCSVIYRTTTLDDAQKRGCGEFQRLHSQAIDNVGLRGHSVRSKPPKVTCGKNTTDLKNV